MSKTVKCTAVAQGPAAKLTFQTQINLEQVEGGERLTKASDDVPVVTWKRSKVQADAFRMCGGTTRLLLWVRKGELKYVNKLNVQCFHLKQDVTGPILDVAPLHDPTQSSDDTIATASSSGRLCVITHTDDYSVVAVASTPKALRIVEWLDSNTLVVLGADGQMWAVDFPLLKSEYLRVAQGGSDVAIDLTAGCNASLQIREASAVIPNFVSTTTTKAGQRIVAVSQSPTPTSVEFYYISSKGVTTTQKMDVDRTEVLGAHWMGSEIYQEYRDIIITVSNIGKSVMFWRVSESGSTLLFHVTLSSTGMWDSGSRWLLDAEGDMAILSARGRTNILVFSLAQEGADLLLSVTEYLLTNAATEGVLHALTIPAFYREVAEKKEHEFCWQSSQKFSRSTIHGTSPPLTEEDTPKPPEAPQPPPPSEPSAPVEKTAPQPPQNPVPSQPPVPPMTGVKAALSKASQYQKPELKTTPLPRLSFTPISKSTARTELGESLLALQNVLEGLQSTFKDNNDMISDRLVNLEKQVHDKKHEVKKSQEVTIELAKELSSDLSKAAHDSYFNPMQREIRGVARKIQEEISELGEFLNAPANKMLEELEKSNKATIDSMEGQLGKFGEDMADFLQAEITKYLKEADLGATVVADALSKELSSQLVVITEKRLQEICQFQLRMELDFESVCNSVRSQLNESFIQAREAASQSAGRQLAVVERQRDERLKAHSQQIQERFEAIRREFQSMSSQHEQAKRDMQERVEQYLQQSEAPVQASPAKFGSQTQFPPPPPTSPIDEFLAAGDYEKAFDYNNNNAGDAKEWRLKVHDKASEVLSSVRSEYVLAVLRDVLICAKTPADAEDTGYWVRAILKAIKAPYDASLFMQLAEWGVSHLTSVGSEFTSTVNLLNNRLSRLS